MAAWPLGLTPKADHSKRPVRIVCWASAKRGDAYVRTLLIHGARAVLKVAGNQG